MAEEEPPATAEEDDHPATAQRDRPAAARVRNVRSAARPKRPPGRAVPDPAGHGARTGPAPRHAGPVSALWWPFAAAPT